jgi:hypothetical protein
MNINFKNWLEATEINWTLPVVNQELSKIQSSTASLKLNQYQLTKALNQAKLVNLPNNVWSKVKNLSQNSNTLPTTQTQTATKQTQTINPVSSQNVKTKVDLKAPIIIMNNNQPYMVSGNDSFQAARNLGTYPKALVASLG